jgi:ferredoxin
MRDLLASSSIVPDAQRCVQCGICSFNCPLGIDIRQKAFQGFSFIEGACLTCGECVRRCPRGVLRFEKAPIMTLSNKE